MKFQCDRCKTKYSIGEDKVRGKVLKIRCKNCSAVITVREGQAVTGGERERGSGSVVGRAPTADAPNVAPNGSLSKAGGASASKSQSPTLEAAFDRAMARPSGAVAAQSAPAAKQRPRDRTQPSAPDEGAFDTEDSASTKLAPVPLPPMDDDGAEVEWYVSVDGDQEGPFNLAAAQRRVARKKPDEELHAWQEGFEDWLPVDRVPELSPHLPAEKKPAGLGSAPPLKGDSGRVGAPARGGASGKAAAAAAEDADDGGSPLSLSALASAAPGPPTGSSDGDFEFDIGEASRVVKLPMLVPGPRGDAGNAAAAGSLGAAARAGQSLPGMAAARGTGGQPIVGSSIVGDDVNPSAAVLIAPPRRKKHGALFWAGSGLFVVVLGVLIVVLLQGGESSGGMEQASNPTSQFVEGFYSENPEMTPIIPGLPPPDPSADPGSGKKPGKRVGSGIVRPPVIAGTNPGGSSHGRGTEDLTDPTLGGVSQRDAEEVLEAQSRFGSGLKWCWERQLKVNPDLKGRGMRLDVTITITASGGVRGVNVVGNDKELRECVRQKVATWSFKAARDDFTTQFPVVFN